MVDKQLLYAVVVMFLVSVTMTYSLSVYSVVSHPHYSDFHFLTRQLIAIVLGFGVMILLSKLDPDRWFVPLGLTIFGLSFLLMASMEFMPSSLVKEIGGAKRWVKIGPISLSPVEFFKVGFTFFLAWSFSRRLLNRKKMTFKEEVRAFTPYLVIFLIAGLVIAVLQKDLGQLVVLGGVLMVLFLLIGSSFKFFFAIMFSAFVMVAMLIRYVPHRMYRIKSWWVTKQDWVLSHIPYEPFQKLHVETSSKEPWQYSNSLNAIHNGGIFGQGLGAGQFKLGYLSEVHTDFVLAGLAEEFGFIGVVFVTVVIFFIVIRIFRLATRIPNPMYYLFSIGIGLLIALAFLINAFGISGLIPIKGIAVPFLSYGGSHILAISFAIGMVLMVAKQVPRSPSGRLM